MNNVCVPKLIMKMSGEVLYCFNSVLKSIERAPNGWYDNHETFQTHFIYYSHVGVFYSPKNMQVGE